MKYPILVTAAIIEKEGTFLITQRPKDGRHNGGRWEFPGGKVEFGEDPRVCLAREISEELDIMIDVHLVFECSSHVYDGEKHIILLAFQCNYISGDINTIDIEDYAWIKPEDAGKYDICEADIPFINKLRQL
ncbi:(deoxy)nucleoside triphosphate pyrophosphohydrolase [Candidatus Woesearchaeota archaeon]|nr:(deoxy)nucleoside triphosphate pyrophosphohydrolase [Candidatus Woesearchaeota archaeon]